MVVEFIVESNEGDDCVLLPKRAAPRCGPIHRSRLACAEGTRSIGRDSSTIKAAKLDLAAAVEKIHMLGRYRFYQGLASRFIRGD